MSNGSPLNELGMGMKAFISAKVAFNSNFGEMSRRNGSADTQSITTLADYMKKESPDKLKNWNPELRDDNKLMKTYVVPMVFPNGERIDIIVNSKGQDIAQIYVNEDPKNRFHLDDSVKAKISMMTEGAIERNANYEREFVPKNLEELAEKISKNELIPKTSEDVKVREQKADKQAFEREQAGEENPEDEKTVEEVAKELGAPPTAIEKFCEDQGIKPGNIKGSNLVQNTSKLQRQLGNKLDVPVGAPVLALRVAGIDNDTKLAIVGIDGTTLDFNETHSNERDEDRLLAEICPEGSNGKLEEEPEFDDTVTVKENGIEKEYEADLSEKAKKELFEERVAKIKSTVESARAEIENDSSLSKSEMARLLADLEATEYAQLEAVQRETGVYSEEISKKELSEAQSAETRAEVEETKDVIKGVAGAAIGTAGAIAGLGVAGITKRPEGHDPREANHDRGEHNL